MFKLVISDDEGKTTVVPLIRDEVTIGRREGNTIRLTDRNVSRTHARLQREDELTFIVEDAGSRNGTKVNGENIGTKPIRITSGDQISIGDYNLSVRTDVSTSVPMGQQMDPGDNAGIGKITTHARLVLLTSNKAGQEFDLTADLYVIGRSDDANLRIPDPSLSRAHARIDGDEHRWTISDLDSVSGIKINGIKRDDYLLKSGDVVELGSVKLRYVAPGEPYEYQPDAEGSITPKPPRSNKLLYILGGIAAVAAIVIVAVVLLTGGEKTDEDSDRPSDEDVQEMSFDELIENGKDRMQDEDWAEAARFFARAILLDPADKTAKELKRTASAEMDAQAALVAALEAGEAKDWKKAVSSLASIPRSSHYYDLEQLQKMAAKLCGELLEKARFIARSGDPNEALAVLVEIADIPEAPDKCLAKKDRLQEDLDRRIGGGGGGAAGGGAAGGGGGGGDQTGKPTGPPKQLEGNPYEKTSKPVNPYTGKPAGGGSSSAKKPDDAPAPSAQPPAYPSSYPSPGSQFVDSEKPPGTSSSKKGSSITWDPVGEARAAIKAGDNKKAIKILEKGGNGRAVLALLAKLYMQTGNKAGYEKVARKFIKLYPNDPKTKGFKKNLGLD
jgi:pSer/pThr/pTyr-binding forkhead associated (FHA) protein/tetratricopeptide (TPR) repeat protein